MIEFSIFDIGTIVIGVSVHERCISIFLGLFGLDIHF